MQSDCPPEREGEGCKGKSAHRAYPKRRELFELETGSVFGGWVGAGNFQNVRKSHVKKRRTVRERPKSVKKSFYADCDLWKIMNLDQVPEDRRKGKSYFDFQKGNKVEPEN